MPIRIAIAKIMNMTSIITNEEKSEPLRTVGKMKCIEFPQMNKT